MDEAQRVYHESHGAAWIRCGACRERLICWPNPNYGPAPQPVAPDEGVDPFLAGLRDGSRRCADQAEALVAAAGAMADGDFVRAQHLLGIDHGDLASQFIQALAQDLTTNVVGEDQDPRAHGERLARRLCTYAGLWSARARGSRGAAPAGNPMQRPPRPHRSLPAPVNPRAVMRESAGADVWAGKYHVDPVTGDRHRVMGVSRTPRSHATSTAANKGEGLAYHEALQRGEIGLQQPAGANVPGTDFITAVLDDAGNVSNVAITDVKTSMRGRFPEPKTAIPGTWQAELLDAISPDRLALSDQALEGAIRNAVAEGRVVLRQINVDLSPTGQGAISGF